MEDKWWKYPLMFGLDSKSTFKSLWLGWWLITWTRKLNKHDFPIPGDLSICFQPGL